MTSVLPENYKSCLVSGKKMVYFEQGEGEPILFVHGITSYSFIWQEVMSYFTDNYKVYAIDLLGCGLSEKVLDIDISIKAQAAFIHEWVNKLHIDKFHLVGHDIGGGICQIYAANHQQNLKSLTLLNSIAYDFWPVQPIIAMRTPIIRQLAMSSIDLGTFRIIVKRALYHKERLDDQLMDKFWFPLKSKNGRKSFLHLARCLNNKHLIEIEERLHKLEIPLLIIRGEADVYLSKEISEKLHREIKGSKLVLLKTAGHFAQIDEPKLIASKMLKFLSALNG